MTFELLGWVIALLIFSGALAVIGFLGEMFPEKLEKFCNLLGL